MRNCWTKLVHSLPTALAGKPQWRASVVVDLDSRVILSIGQGTGNFDGSVELDTIHLKPGYNPQVGEVFDPNRVDDCIEIKTSVSGYIDPQQRIKQQTVMGRDIKSVNGHKIWRPGTGWEVNKKYLAGFRIFHHLGAASSAVGLGFCVYAIVVPSNYDAELETCAVRLNAVKYAAPNQKKGEALECAELINAYVRHFVPPGTIRDLFELAHIYVIAGIDH